MQQKAEFLKQINSFNSPNTLVKLKDLNNLKAKIKDLEAKIINVATQQIIDYESLQKSKQILIEIVLKAREIEIEYNQALELELNDKDLVELMNSNNQFDLEINTLKANLFKKTEKLNQKKSQIESQKNELINLNQSKNDAEKRESEAIRL